MWEVTFGMWISDSITPFEVTFLIWIKEII